MMPQAGQVVHFVERNGEHCRAAIFSVNRIVALTVDLVVFPRVDSPNWCALQSLVPYSGTMEIGTWHWTEPLEVGRGMDSA